MRLRIRSIVFVIAIFYAFAAFAQNPAINMQRADRLRLTYDFKAAQTIYNFLLERESDPASKNIILEKIALCENGQEMMSYVTRPETVKKITVPAADFYLWYSHLNNWRILESGELLLFDDGDRKIIYSSISADGKKQLYQSVRLSDTLWSTPTLLGEAFVSTGNEILPIISADGKKLYFSSDGLYGMGGYDLFVSTYNEQDGKWSVPENLGFPFSSTYDDLMFSTTPNKDYSLFASNRDCHADSMTIYLLKYDSNPLKIPLNDIEEIRKIAAMNVIKHVKNDDTSNQNMDNTPEDEMIASYIAFLEEYRAAKDSLENIQVSDTDAQHLTARMSSLSDKILDMEMEFLMQGKIISADDFAPKQQTVQQQQEIAEEYVFNKQTIGDVLKLNFEIIQEDKPDYSFRIQDTTMLVSGLEPPDGVLYQIQLYANANKTSVAKFKGLSPVFEQHEKGGYRYTVGYFTSYEETVAALPTVKKHGFQNAFIIAYKNGEKVNTSVARTAEKQLANAKKYRIVFSDYPDNFPSAIMALIRNKCNKDIARIENDGTVAYIIAPFESKTEAQNLVDYLTSGGATGMTIQEY